MSTGIRRDVDLDLLKPLEEGPLEIREELLVFGGVFHVDRNPPQFVLEP
jgi:hypothetical protein